MSIIESLLQKSGYVKIDNSNNSSQYASFFNIIYGDKTVKSYSSQELVALNTNYVSICNKKNAVTCASIPLKLYYINKGKKIERTHFKNISKKHALKLAKQWRIQLKANENIVEIEDHPYLDLMNNVNTEMNSFDFTALNQMYLGLIGNAYVRIEFDKENKPINLYPLLGEYITCFASNGKDGVISKYEYALPGENKVTYKADEILHFKNYAPGSNIVGRGELEECVSVVELFNYAMGYESYLGKNNGRPDFAIAYKNQLNEKDLKEVYKQWMKRFGNINNSGKPVITGGEYDIKNLGFNPKDMSYSALKTFCINEIGNAYGIPEAILFLNNANLASAQVAMQMYKQLTIYPKMFQYVQKINEKLMPMYDSNLYVGFETDSEIEDLNKVTNISNALSAGIISRDEAREMLGLEKDGDNSGDSSGDINEEQV